MKRGDRKCIVTVTMTNKIQYVRKKKTESTYCTYKLLPSNRHLSTKANREKAS